MQGHFTEFFVWNQFISTVNIRDNLHFETSPVILFQDGVIDKTEGLLLVQGRGSPVRKPSRFLCYSTVGISNIGEFLFGTHLKTGKQSYGSNQETEQLSCWKSNRIHFFNKIAWFMSFANVFCKLTRIILLWPFVSHPTTCKWVWLKIE